MATAKDNTDPLIDEPLDTLEIRLNSKNGIQTTVSALNIGFMEKRNYVHFKSPPVSTTDTGQGNMLAEKEEWLECATFLKEDLHWVLKLPHFRFWSQVVYDENLHKCLESYLCQAPRDYDLVNLQMEEDVLCSLKKIHKLVFLVYLRMSTYKESKKHHIRPAAFGSIIYDNFIFDIPKIMDLCVLYGIQNLTIVSKMVQNIFSSQPTYFEDLNKTSQAVLEAFSNIEEKLSTNLHEMKSSSSNHLVNGVNTKKKFTLSSFHDVVNYVTDVSATLHALLEVFSPASQTFYQNGAAIRIATFYENAVPTIEREVSRRSKESESERIVEDIKRKIILSKTLLIKNFRNILINCCIENILNSTCSESKHNVSENLHVEQFLDIFTEIAAEKNFLYDYNNLYPFEVDVELFTEMGLNLDPQRLNYIYQSIHDMGEISPENFKSSVANGARPKVKKQVGAQMCVKSFQDVTDAIRGSQRKNRDDFSPETSMRVGRNGLDEYEICSVIQSVQDVLPELGDGFIEKCLEHLHYDPARVIDAVLTQSLPDHLIALDRNLKREIKSDEGFKSEENYSILSERKNVFDNDEFDIFSSNDVDMDRVHIGKKNKTPTTYQALENDQESEFLKQLTLTYGSEETEYNDERNLYEDEYDDTYDSAMVGLKEPAPEGVPDTDVPDERKNGESQGNSSETSRDRSRDFCENPELIRERAQQRRDSKMSARGNKRGGPPPDQTHNRQNKDRNKSHVGNHNRRKQSDFKRSRGMIPS